MGVINLTPDSFYPDSRVDIDSFIERVEYFVSKGASYIDIGAVSTRPGALEVSIEEEWYRLEPALKLLNNNILISIDTTSSEIVRRVYDIIGSFTVNDISAGEDDPEMLTTVGRLGLEYIAMHKRGNPRTMDTLCNYNRGVVTELLDYFKAFETKALENNINNWILDPGLGFAKTVDQNWEILNNLDQFSIFNRPILIGAADKRFTGGDTEKAHQAAINSSLTDLILRVHR